MTRVGSIELGGTKIRMATGSADGAIADCETIPTTTPEKSFARIRAFFGARDPVAAIGVGAFGPVAIDPDGEGFGRLGETPKPGWRHFDLGAAMREMSVPFALDTDVNAAGIGEAAVGALAALDSGVYLTVGTGIGGALIVGGRLVNGVRHPEMGHIILARAAADDGPSVCPFHASCAEGLASGPAIQRRFGASLSELPAEHAAHELEAGYLGQLVADLVLMAAPARIVIGGGVSKAPGLHERVRRAALDTLNGYALYPEVEAPGFVEAPLLGDDAGLVGGLILAGRLA